MQFDVPGWIATLGGCAREKVVYRGETEQSGLLSVSYECDLTPANVDLVAIPMGDSGRASWQVSARIGDRAERVQVPGNTRFLWR